MADRFIRLEGRAVPIMRSDIDTDTISPGSPPRRAASGTGFSERGTSTLADDLFGNWRYTPEGEIRPEFPLNQERYQGARILITGSNFGCGSSRESAVWMLKEWGISCIIAPSFADIFSANCFSNGVLPVVLPTDTVSALAAQVEADPAGLFEVDLQAGTIVKPDGEILRFETSEFRRRALLEGLDEISVTLGDAVRIDDFIAHAAAERSWIVPAATTL